MVFVGGGERSSCCVVSGSLFVMEVVGVHCSKLKLVSFMDDLFSLSYMLGDCLLDGEGVEMDRGSALEWLIRSAELGHR